MGGQLKIKNNEHEEQKQHLHVVPDIQDNSHTDFIITKNLRALFIGFVVMTSLLIVINGFMGWINYSLDDVDDGVQAIIKGDIGTFQVY